jgi:hypothetical protein
MPDWFQPTRRSKWHALEAGTPGFIMRGFCGVMGGNVNGWVGTLGDDEKRCLRCKAILKSRRREERENEDSGSRVD